MSLYLSCLPLHAALPNSLPRRRSSDLAPATAAPARSPPCRSGPGTCRPRGRATARPRSEEHTSELQSLTNLVCRLLIEKKKKQSKDLKKKKNKDDKHTYNLQTLERKHR